MSDRQIWLCLRIVMGCSAFLSVLIGFCSDSDDSLKLNIQTCPISLSKSKPTRPVPLKCSAPTHTLGCSFCIAPHHNPARPCSALSVRRSYTGYSYPRPELCAGLCDCCDSSNLLLAHTPKHSQYRMVGLCPHGSVATPFIPFAYSSRKGEHLTTGGIEV